MRKTFVSNLILLIALNLLVKPFYILGIEAEIQNRVGTDTFGSYFALINFSFILNIFLDAGTTNWNTRNIARNPDLLGKHFPHLLSLRILLTVIYALLAGAFGIILGYSTSQLIILAILVFNQALASLILFLRSNLTGLHMFRQDSFISILDRLLLTAAMSYLLWSGFVTDYYFNISWLVWGQTAAYGITAIIALILVLRKAGKLRFTFDKSFSLSVLKNSLPYALLTLFGMLAYRLDSVILERISGAEEAGVYAMGFRFFEAFNMISYLFAVLLLPIFARMIRKKEDVSQLLILAAKIMLVGTLVATLIGIFWNLEIIEFVYRYGDDRASLVFALLMIGCASFSLQYVFGTLLTASGNMKPMVRLAAMALLINVSMNFILIPRYGAIGAAISNCATQGFVLIGQVYLVHKNFRIQTGHMPIQALVFVVATTALAWFIHERSTIYQLPFAYSLAIFAALAILLAILTRMLDFRRFLQMVKSGE